MQPFKHTLFHAFIPASSSLGEFRLEIPCGRCQNENALVNTIFSRVANWKIAN